MKKSNNIILGFGITILIYLLSMLAGGKIPLNVAFIPKTFMTDSLMILLTISAVFFFKKTILFRITSPKLKSIFKPIALGFISTIIINVFFSIITKVVGIETETHPLIMDLSPMQIIVFAFIFASIAEEFLFRGFLQNMLKNLQPYGIHLFHRKISLPVLISAILFGLGHLILITSGVGEIFLIRIVTSTFLLGLIAGYYQEKYNNFAFAIIVHMSGNLTAVIASLLMFNANI